MHLGGGAFAASYRWETLMSNCTRHSDGYNGTRLFLRSLGAGKADSGKFC